MASTSDIHIVPISIDDILQQLSVGITPARTAINNVIDSMHAPRDITRLLYHILFNNTSMLSIEDYQYEDNYYFIILLKCLRYNTSIVQLKFYVKMDDDVMKEFSTMLGHNRYIKKVDILSPISQHSEEYLIDALKMNTSLIELFIYSPEKEPNEMNNHFFIQNILKYLKLNTTITTLAIYDIHEINVNHICDILIHNNTLERLYINYCDINADDVNKIISCLKYNTNLLTLNLYRNSSDIDTINVIADVLKYNNTINTIFIDFVNDPSDVIDDEVNDNNINSKERKKSDFLSRFDFL